MSGKMNESIFEANIEWNWTYQDETNVTQDELDIPSEYEETSSTIMRKKTKQTVGVRREGYDSIQEALCQLTQPEESILEIV
jgi:hypothetical protein